MGVLKGPCRGHQQRTTRYNTTFGHPQHFVNSVGTEEAVFVASMPTIMPQLATGSPMRYGLMHAVKGHFIKPSSHCVFSCLFQGPFSLQRRWRQGGLVPPVSPSGIQYKELQTGLGMKHHSLRHRPGYCPMCTVETAMPPFAVVLLRLHTICSTELHLSYISC